MLSIRLIGGLTTKKDSGVSGVFSLNLFLNSFCSNENVEEMIYSKEHGSHLSEVVSVTCPLDDEDTFFCVVAADYFGQRSVLGEEAEEHFFGSGDDENFVMLFGVSCHPEVIIFNECFQEIGFGCDVVMPFCADEAVKLAIA